MGQWLKANGGPLAIVVVGITISGFTDPPLGTVVMAIGLVWFVGGSFWRWGLRSRLATYITDGGRIHQRIFEANSSPDDCRRAFADWHGNVDRSLRHHQTARARFTRPHPGTPFQYTGISREKSAIAVSLEEDLERLNEILREQP